METVITVRTADRGVTVTRSPIARPVLAVVAVLGVLVSPACASSVAGPSRLLSRLAGVGADAAPSADLGQVVAAVVDIDTTLGRRHAVGAGTGIVLDSLGLVLTNNHVIEGATAISATDVGNARTYTARVVGHDHRHDIALLQLRGASGLATAPLGDSSRVAVWDRVVGIGNAGGRGGVPGQAPGTVSALNQTVSARDDLTHRSEVLTGLIQIAAAVRPGDSGGPLVTGGGQVVGIDTAAGDGYRVERAQGGQGFAIPIDEALQIAHQLAPQR
jgi:S1-C subfamily serine protease